MPATPLIRPPCMRPREESRIRYPYRRRGIRPERRHKVRSRKRVSHLAPLLVQTQPSAGTKQSPQRTGTSSSLNSKRYEAGMREAVGGQFGCAIAQIKWDMLLERHRATKAVATVRSKAEGIRTITPYNPLRYIPERSTVKVSASAMKEHTSELQ